MRSKQGFMSAFVCATGALLAANGLAQAPPVLPTPARVPAVIAGAAAAEPDAYGTSATTVLKIHASAFRPQCGSTTLTAYWDTTLTYIESNYNGCMLYAPAPLPVGALVTQVGFDGKDLEPVLDIDWGIYWVSVDSSDTNGHIAWYTSSQSGGSFNTTATLPTPVTVDSTKYYFALVDLQEASQNMCIKGMRVVYKLQVSPAPASATFPDVPTSYWAFQYIEALAASGITAGCGGGNYCPETYVKRSEMAVFLSKALGLHWPN